MKLLYWFESIRFPLLDQFMLLITHLGEETIFLVVAIVIFWCIDKWKGYYIMSVGFIGTIINQFLKMTFRIDRPFEIDPNFKAVPGALKEATGFSFPSGHTQSSVGTFGSIAQSTKDKLCRFFCIVVAILVPLSRMYLGVHTPQDVLFSLAISIGLIFLLYPVTMGNHKKFFPAVIGAMILLGISYLLFTCMYKFPDNINHERLSSGKESAFTLLGALIGLVITYIVDEKWLHFPVKAVWWAQGLKVIIGLGLVLAVKSGLKGALNALCGDSIGRLVRYFLVVLVAGVVWPMTFKWFAGLGNKE